MYNEKNDFCFVFFVLFKTTVSKNIYMSINAVQQK